MKSRALGSRMMVSVSRLIPSAPLVSGQLLTQRFGLLQILRVEPFSEPIVGLRQQLPGFFPVALLLSQAGEAHPFG